MGQATNFPAVQGIVVTVDRLWRHLVRLRTRLPPRQFEDYSNFLGSGILHYVDFAYLAWPSFYLQPRFDDSFISGPLDWSWRPKWWPDYQRYMQRGEVDNPILAQIYLLPWSPGEELPSSQGYPFSIVFERREQARLCKTKTRQTPLVGGLSIGAGLNISGTLGGILRDQRDYHYGLTCAHVVVKGNDVDQPAKSDNSTDARSIGAVIADSDLKKGNSTAPCNPQNPKSIMNQIDAALIELNAASQSELKILTLGKLTRTLPEMDLNPGDSLYFVGKESGPQTRRLVVGGLGPTFRFKDDNGDFYCFENTLQVEWPSTTTGAIGCPVEQGDSGAWLCSADGNGYAWAGMVIGSHRDLGYALFAERLLTWADTKIGSPPLEVT